jgi:hypothetical protein
MNWKAYLEADENILVGEPVIKGTRVSVEHIINLLASGWSNQQILEKLSQAFKREFTGSFCIYSRLHKRWFDFQ